MGGRAGNRGEHMKGIRRVILLDRSRALPLCLGLWLARPLIGTPTLGIA
jgi:hypothetical protein